MPVCTCKRGGTTVEVKFDHVKDNEWDVVDVHKVVGKRKTKVDVDKFRISIPYGRGEHLPLNYQLTAHYNGNESKSDWDMLFNKIRMNIKERKSKVEPTEREEIDAEKLKTTKNESEFFEIAKSMEYHDYVNKVGDTGGVYAMELFYLRKAESLELDPETISKFFKVWRMLSPSPYSVERSYRSSKEKDKDHSLSFFPAKSHEEARRKANIKKQAAIESKNEGMAAHTPQGHLFEP